MWWWDELGQTDPEQREEILYFYWRRLEVEFALEIWNSEHDRLDS